MPGSGHQHPVDGPAVTALATDLYELTMAYGYWHAGRAEHEAVFNLVFRKHPFGGGYTIAAGLPRALAFLQNLRFEDGDLDYLARLTDAAGRQLFPSGFLAYLEKLRFTCDVDALPEGSVVFPHEPLMRVCGPLLQAQLVESALLNLINFPSLVATKAARVCRAAGDGPVLEFGLRRAQGPDGGLSASRAAYLGGCAGTSNVLAGQRYGIPVKGTHAHSWVQAYGDELRSFRDYARAMPDNSVLLVDTYDSLEGVRHAVTVGRELRAGGHRLLGIRLDSGDLAWLSREARRLLDEAGLEDTAILASNELDEYMITSLRQQGACIDRWGVGTRLATGAEDGALGGVYKLAAIRDDDGAWQPRLKLSEQTAKISIPGRIQVRRYSTDDGYACDTLYDQDRGLDPEAVLVDPGDSNRRRRPPAGAEFEDLLVPVMRDGRCASDPDDLETARHRCREQLDRFYPGCLRLHNPHEYPVGLDRGLHRQRQRLIARARGHAEEESP